tara:strand:+ start:179 stop:673 length:495 start_codon:yes stop_codon:yes gene_type:complete
VDYSSHHVEVQFSGTSPELAAISTVVCVEVTRDEDGVFHAAPGAELRRQPCRLSDPHPTVKNNSGHRVQPHKYFFRSSFSGLAPTRQYRLWVDIPEKRARVNIMYFAAPPLAEDTKSLKRIAYWYGKVNQYVDEVTGEWRTTPGGNAGADIAQLGETLAFRKIL